MSFAKITCLLSLPAQRTHNTTYMLCFDPTISSNCCQGTDYGNFGGAFELYHLIRSIQLSAGTISTLEEKLAPSSKTKFGCIYLFQSADPQMGFNQDSFN